MRGYVVTAIATALGGVLLLLSLHAVMSPLPSSYALFYLLLLPLPFLLVVPILRLWSARRRHERPVEPSWLAVLAGLAIAEVVVLSLVASAGSEHVGAGVAILFGLGAVAVLLMARARGLLPRRERNGHVGAVTGRRSALPLLMHLLALFAAAFLTVWLLPSRTGLTGPVAGAGFIGGIALVLLLMALAARRPSTTYEASGAAGRSRGSPWLGMLLVVPVVVGGVASASLVPSPPLGSTERPSEATLVWCRQHPFDVHLRLWSLGYEPLPDAPPVASRAEVVWDPGLQHEYQRVWLVANPTAYYAACRQASS